MAAHKLPKQASQTCTQLVSLLNSKYDLNFVLQKGISQILSLFPYSSVFNKGEQKYEVFNRESEGPHAPNLGLTSQKIVSLFNGLHLCCSLSSHTKAINAQNCCVVGFVIIENKTSVLSVAVYSQRISCPGRQVVIAVCDTLKCEDASYFWT